jgi:hypothetical protein
MMNNELTTSLLKAISTIRAVANIAPLVGIRVCAFVGGISMFVTGRRMLALLARTGTASGMGRVRTP